jgi:hypothetical protein
MKISAVYDAAGNIVSAHELKDAPGAAFTLRQEAGPGEHIEVFDVPSHHASQKFSDFAHMLHVNVSAAKHHLADR